jgi:uncharacterized protein YceH (UPF0502 family)
VRGAVEASALSEGRVYDAGPVPPGAVELRALGCLIEKQHTTPDNYPLSINSLRQACNQATNRDPVTVYDEETVIDGLERLGRRGWSRFASGAGSRARKYRHVFDEALSLDAEEISLLCVLMLRGAQTPGELKQRTERLHPFRDLAAVYAALEGLIERGLALRLPRRPGQKEQRYVHLLAGEEVAAEQAEREAAGSAVDGRPSSGAAGADTDRLDRLERELAELRTEVEGLRDALGG